MFPLINFDVPSKRAKGGFFLYPHKQHGLTRLVGRPRKRAEYVHMQEAVGAGEGGETTPVKMELFFTEQRADDVTGRTSR